MRIGFAGVAHSHPFSDARNARTLGVAELAVWDPDDHSRRADFVQAWQAITHPSLAALLDWEPDVVIVTPRPQRVAAVVSAVLDRGVACFLNKVPAADAAGLAALDAAVGDRYGRFLTCSVLRFAPGIRALAAELAGAEPIAAHLSVRHGIDAFTTAARRWQDDPADGGGTAVSMGLHAWEMLDTVLGREATPLGGVTSRIAGSATISENVVALHAVAGGGVPVSVDIVGAGIGECYEVAVHIESGIRRVSLEQPGELGYLDCLRAVLAMAEGAPTPVPWPRSRAVVRTTLAAAQLVRTGD
ncbi:hypothetical protein [Nocardia sp. NBC_01329]|uniref:hypothetical protein n=1 Tax=Nocardia sp. NBC_01329 TaxID=2903594 RepID=UPI002E0F5CB7|nr:hypothetical protein OG405_12150 [Nocardia sp. NBC_01329]